ncbi:MAG: hypothetical protein QMB65_04775, partial [Vicingaceae bacterium]
MNLLKKDFGYNWIYNITADNWDKLLTICNDVLSLFPTSDDDDDDEKLSISLRGDSATRLGIILGNKYVGGFYLGKGEILVRFYLNNKFDHIDFPNFEESVEEFKDNNAKLVYLKLEHWKGVKDNSWPVIKESLQEYYPKASKNNYKKYHSSDLYQIITDSDKRKEFLDYLELSPQERLVQAYKQYLREVGLDDELYKWVIGKRFKDNLDLDAADFSEMLKSLKPKNLLAQQAISFISLARKNPEEAREYYKLLFDESISIQDRFKKCSAKGKELIKKWHPTWTSAGQDERTFSVFLAFNDLKHHVPYKNSFYLKFCQLLGVNNKKSGNKYEHYVSLVDDFVDKCVINDEELLSLHNKDINPEIHIEDPRHHLLVQNMLYIVLDCYWAEEKEESSSKVISNYKEEYVKWMNSTNTEESNKSSSYIRALDILSEKVEYNVFEKSNTSELKILYDDLILNQSDENGMYFHKDAPSYGKNKYFSAAIATYIEFHKEFEKIDPPPMNIPESASITPLNQILYGPPGTGKTYTVKAEAVRIVNPHFQIVETESGRKLLNEEYNRLVESGLISFTTFHQSMSYEDFVEGIKPQTTDDGTVEYVIEDGIFKRMAVQAAFYKGLRDNNEGIGKAAKLSSAYSNLKNDIEESFSQNSPFIVNTKSGQDLIVESVSDKGNLNISHKGKDKTYIVSFNRLIKLHNEIENLEDVKNIDKRFREIIGGSNSSAYWSILNKLRTDYLLHEDKINDGYYTYEDMSEAVKNFPLNKYSKNSGARVILVIDEINRGNVSAIFGELITLLEPDKRAGEKEALEVTLPYSKDKFS